ncbi:type II secretion system F family protein [Streptomyces sp. YGL11-2]|uniref:type II secretion system F family protein n=1 Tax=Streptomyces sp. YGL11-2 TaxID=3414028 RepID=UPI003CF34347
MAATVMAVTAVARSVPLVRAAQRGRAVRRRVPAVLGAVRGGRYGRAAGVRGRWAAVRGRNRGMAAARQGGRCGGRLREWGGPLGAAGLVAVLLGGVAGLVVGLAVGWGAYRWLVRQRAAAAGQTAAVGVGAELATAGDLLAACLAAGAGPREAAEVVGRSLEGTVAERLRQIAAELRLGGEPAAVWPRLAALPGAAGLARCLARAGISGAPAVESASRVAAGLRAERGRAATARARRAGVLVTLPLSGCFLPAFLVLGVAPVLIGLAGGLLGRD